MKIKRILTAAVAAAVLALSVTPFVCAAGNGTFVLTPSSSAVRPGDTFTVAVNFSVEDGNMCSGKLPVLFDASVVEFVSAEAGVQGATLTAESAKPGKVNNAFMFMDSCKDASGTLYICTFKAVSEGTAAFSFENGCYVMDGHDVDYTMSVTGCSVTVSASSASPVQPSPASPPSAPSAPAAPAAPAQNGPQENAPVTVTLAPVAENDESPAVPASPVPAVSDAEQTPADTSPNSAASPVSPAAPAGVPAAAPSETEPLTEKPKTEKTTNKGAIAVIAAAAAAIVAAVIVLFIKKR